MIRKAALTLEVRHKPWCILKTTQIQSCRESQKVWRQCCKNGSLFETNWPGDVEQRLWLGSVGIAQSHRQKRMQREEWQKQRPWDRRMHWQIQTLPRLTNQLQHPLTTDVACITFSHCKQILWMRSHCCSITLRAIAMCACFFQNFIVSWIWLKCCGVMQNIISYFCCCFVHLLTYKLVRLSHGMWWPIYLPLWELWYCSVWICVIHSLFRDSFGKLGDIWTHTCLFYYPLPLHIANLPDHSKELDAKQTAFAVKKYWSHCHVRLPNEIIALMQAWTQASDTQQCLFSSPRLSSLSLTQECSF